MNKICLLMAKWATNSKHLKEVRRTDFVDLIEVTQTLGIDWETESDAYLMDPDMSSANTLKALQLRGNSAIHGHILRTLSLLSPISVGG
jgi:hypothetical protein